MKSIAELTDFYYKELVPSLEQFEEERKNIVWKIKLYGTGLGLISIFILILIAKSYSVAHPFFLILAFVFIVIIGFLYNWLAHSYNDQFKSKVIAPIIQAIDASLLYNPGFPVSQNLFQRSQLFKHSIDRYRGNDYVKGTISGVDVEFSDVHAEYETRDSKGRSQWHTLFKGLFIVSSFNKNFKGRTVVLPDLAQNNFGTLIGGWLQSINFTRDDLVRLDDPEFEKHFAVYGNDQIESRYILSHSMMQRIVDLRKKLNVSIHISFIANHMHIAVETNRDHFEPNVFTSLLDYNQTMEYLRTLHSTIGLVEELKLNENLWSKI